MNYAQLTEIRGWTIDWERRGFVWATITVYNGKIGKVEKDNETFVSDPETIKVGPFIFPGLIDSHVHIESSMMVPSRFAEIALRHGTVATVSDPHEIANVLGEEGVLYMMENAKEVPLKFHFTFPSCVPATVYETSGEILNAKVVERNLKTGNFIALGEMMNYPGVIYDDREVWEKISCAQRCGLWIDGHAPGLNGEDLQRYVNAGITTDHECSNIEEAVEKIGLGMKILIREGSAARNFDALHTLIDSHPEMVMLCCDDIHPDDLCEGHINTIIKKGLDKGISLCNLIRAATRNPIEHYGLNVGLLRKGDPADFIIVKELKTFQIDQTWINGRPVYQNGKLNIKVVDPPHINKFVPRIIKADNFKIHGQSGEYRVIHAIDGELVTEHEIHVMTEKNGIIDADLSRDILKIAVINRYQSSPVVNGFIRGFGITNGAIASSIAHDSHNIIVVGTNGDDMARAVMSLMDNRGGIAVCNSSEVWSLPLPVAGLMSCHNGEEVGRRYRKLTEKAIEQGSVLKAPFMTLSFMALLVIPSLKIGDRGLFDGDKFEFIPLQVIPQ